MQAECQCGQLSIELPLQPMAVVACHCIACQRRSGSPFGVLAQYATDDVSVSGDARRFERSTDEGNYLRDLLLSDMRIDCLREAGKHPTLTLVALGAIGDPSFQAPVRSIFEESKHHWMVIPGDIEHHVKGRGKL